MGRLIDADKVEQITWQEPSYTDALNVLTEVREKVRELPTVEAIPKDQYEARLKADMVTMLTDIQLEIEELDTPNNNGAYMDCSEIIQQKIDALKDN